MNVAARLWCVLLACVAGGVAVAQQPQSQNVVQRAVTLNLASQPLQDALHQFSAATGLKVMFLTELGRGVMAPRVSGTLTPEAALDLLLKGANLRFEFLDSQTVAVLPVRERPADSALKPMSYVNASSVQTPSTDSVVDNASGRKSPLSSNEAGSDLQTEASRGTEGASLQEVVVTAQRRIERLQDVPISISVLGGETLDKSSAVSVTDSLSMIPGVVATVPDQGVGTLIAVRGVSAGGAVFNGSSPIGYYLDSVPFGLVKTAIGPDEDAYDLQRIEVLRGPQGTLYGASSEGGLVRVLTNDADLYNFELKARGGLSTTDSGGENYRGDMAINAPIVDGKLAVRAVVGYQDLSGWIDSQVQTHANDAELRNYRLKIDAQPTDALFIGLSAWSTRNDYGAPSTAADNGRNNTAFIPQPISTNYDAYGAKIVYTAPLFTVTSSSSYLKYQNNSIEDLTPYGAPGNYFTTDLGSKVATEEIVLNSAAGSAWNWTAGAFYRNGKDDNFQIVTILPVPIAWSDASKSYAIFGEVGQRFFNDEFGWTLGLRNFHDRVDTDELIQSEGLVGVPLLDQSASYNATTPRAVLTWYPNRQTTIYTSFSEGFRSGSPQIPSVVESAPGFQTLKPDKLYNYELGAKAAVTSWLSIDTSVYYIDWRNVQQLITVPVSGVCCLSVLINGNAASGPGFDLAMTARPLDGLELGASFSWNGLSMDKDVFDGSGLLFSKGNRLNYSAEYTGGLSADYTFPLGGSRLSGVLSASASYSSQASNRGNFGDNFTTYGNALFFARSSFAIRSSRWSATFFVDNISNDHGAGPASEPFPDLAPRPRPRTVGLLVDCDVK